jgi:hypothetical protein
MFYKKIYLKKKKVFPKVFLVEEIEKGNRKLTWLSPSSEPNPEMQEAEGDGCRGTGRRLNAVDGRLLGSWQSFGILLTHLLWKFWVHPDARTQI